MDELRRACAQVARRARFVRVQTAGIPAYATGLEPAPAGAAHVPAALAGTAREQQAGFWLTMDAINFGSGWFPTLHKREGGSGYHTIFAALKDHWETCGPWSPSELTTLDAATVAAVFGQEPDHPLMALFAASLNDLGRHVAVAPGSSFSDVVDAAHGSAVTLARRLGGWAGFADCSRYQELELPFLKRAQIAAADLARAGVAQFGDLDRLTMFADNLVPHVLRLDGVLVFEPELVARIDAGELIEHGSAEEIEIRACALHAVELIVPSLTAAGKPTRAADVDELLWTRGGRPFYKAARRHRTRCTAY
jgi:hypothetical protein